MKPPARPAATVRAGCRTRRCRWCWRWYGCCCSRAWRRRTCSARAVLALALPRLLHGFIGDSVRPRSPRTMLHLAGVVLWDIVMSNLTVARIVL